jgi:hypothetical protein
MDAKIICFKNVPNGIPDIAAINIFCGFPVGVNVLPIFAEVASAIKNGPCGRSCLTTKTKIIQQTNQQRQNHQQTST